MRRRLIHDVLRLEERLLATESSGSSRSILSRCGARVLCFPRPCSTRSSRASAGLLAAEPEPVGRLAHFALHLYRWRALTNSVSAVKAVNTLRGMVPAGFVLAVGVLFSVASPADAAEGAAYVMVDVQCDHRDQGVLDLTLLNESQTAPATFVVLGGQVVTVPPQSAQAITLTDLDDGPLAVSITIDGVDASANVVVECDGPTVEVLPGPPWSGPSASQLPATGSEAGLGVVIGGLLVAAGVIASLVARRHYS